MRWIVAIMTLSLLAGASSAAEPGALRVELGAGSKTKTKPVTSGAKAKARPVLRRGAGVRATPPQPAAPFRWRPADPSFDQNGRLYRPPAGLPCPVDVGYGRWASCLDDL